MRPFELLADSEEQAARAFKSRQAGIWTALPGIIQSFDPVKMTCVVQPAIKAVLFAQDGSASDVALPLLLDCPVQFPSGGGFTQTFPLKEGVECLVVFASRCIDAWWASGGIQSQAEMRMHDLSDGFCIPGIRSVPNVIANISLTSTQLRSDDGSTFVDVAEDAVKIVAPTSVTVESAATTIAAPGGAAQPLVNESFYTWFESTFMPAVSYVAGAPAPPAAPLTTTLTGE